jgi:hypothetical protein
MFFRSFGEPGVILVSVFPGERNRMVRKTVHGRAVSNPVYFYEWEGHMKAAIVSLRESTLREFARGFGGDMEWFSDPGELLKQAPGSDWNVVVLDTLLPGLEAVGFLRDLLHANNLLHTAVMSDMSESEIMERCAGLGVLCAIPAHPTWEDGARVMNQLCLFYDMG